MSPEANGSNRQAFVVLPQDRVQRKCNPRSRNSPNEQKERTQEDLVFVRRDLGEVIRSARESVARAPATRDQVCNRRNEEQHSRDDGDPSVRIHLRPSPSLEAGPPASAGPISGCVSHVARRGAGGQPWDADRGPLPCHRASSRPGVLVSAVGRQLTARSRLAAAGLPYRNLPIGPRPADEPTLPLPASVGRGALHADRRLRTRRHRGACAPMTNGTRGGPDWSSTTDSCAVVPRGDPRLKGLRVKAVVCVRYGPPEVLQLREVDTPAPRRNEVCIRIFATGADIE